MSEDLINIVIKAFFINIYTMLVDFKIMNYNTISINTFIRFIINSYKFHFLFLLKS